MRFSRDGRRGWLRESYYVPNSSLEFGSIVQSIEEKLDSFLFETVLQGPSWQTVFFELRLRDRNMQVRFFLEGGFEILRFEKFC